MSDTFTTGILTLCALLITTILLGALYCCATNDRHSVFRRIGHVALILVATTLVMAVLAAVALGIGWLAQHAGLHCRSQHGCHLS